MAKKDTKPAPQGKGKGKKKDAGPSVELAEELIQVTDLETTVAQQFTDTSYTSASYEEMPVIEIVVEEVIKKKPKKKKKVEEPVPVFKAPSIIFLWSEDSLPDLPLDEEEKKVEEEEVKKRKGKKGKKEKKKVEEIPDFEKPKNWKQMNSKDRQKWLEKMIEEWRIQQEAEKQAFIAETKEKRKQEQKDRIEQFKRDKVEQKIREDILVKTCNWFDKFEKQKLEYLTHKQLKAQWAQYVRCDGLPDPVVITEVATYLHRWRELNIYDPDQLERRCKEVLPMLEMLDELVVNPAQFTPRQFQNFIEIRIQLRTELANTIEFASYTILRDLVRNTQWHSIRRCDYHRYFPALLLNLWIAVRMPTKLPHPDDVEPQAVELTFPAIKVTVTLPKTLDASCLGVRAARSLIDLLSERSKTFKLAIPVAISEDLFTFNVKELITLEEVKKKQDVIRNAFFKKIRERTKELEAILKSNVYAKFEAEKEELDNLSLQEPPFMLQPREFCADADDKAFKKWLRCVKRRTRNGEINLRQYIISGGVLNMDLLIIPPQPKRLPGEIWLSALELPKALQTMSWMVQYRQPPPPEPGVTREPEEIEAEMKQVEAEFQKLALVFIELPTDILWCEPPTICQWHEKRRYWTTNYVNDYKFNEEKLTLQFRTGILWPIGIATFRYANLPYQGWDMRPNLKGNGVIIQVVGVFVTVTFSVTANKVKLTEIANMRTKALAEHINKGYTVKRLVQIMREAACNFFPDFDGHNYVEGTCAKEWACEKHNYHAMAFLSLAYNFQWSRWNIEAGRRHIIMQLREAVNPKRLNKFKLLDVAPTNAVILKYDEQMAELDRTPMIGLPFFPDLFTLNMSYGSSDARRKAFEMTYKIVETTWELLKELKISSYS